MKNKIIIDTDPGVDDALAIMFAIKYGCNIQALVTVFGNSNIKNTSLNALKILTILGSKIPVLKGAGNPINGLPLYAGSHGAGGFGGFNIDLKNSLKTQKALDYYIFTLEKSKAKEITIICLGPTTNIAQLFSLRPDLIGKINKLIILGGVFYESGNISKYAEFNVYNDPLALKQVLNLGLDIYLIPINVCRKVYFDTNDFDRINNKNISSSIKEITNQYIDYYKNNNDYGKFPGGVMYDLLATGFYVKPELFSFKKAFIEVITSDQDNKGETKEILDKNPNCNLIISVNTNGLKELFFNTMNNL